MLSEEEILSLRRNDQQANMDGVVKPSHAWRKNQKKLRKECCEYKPEEAHGEYQPPCDAGRKSGLEKAGCV